MHMHIPVFNLPFTHYTSYRYHHVPPLCTKYQCHPISISKSISPQHNPY